jgi:acyl-CoA thioester hydrolase
MQTAQFTSSFIVGDDDIDMLGHASNIAYLRWIQDVAVAHSEAMGLGIAGYRRIGGIFVIRRHEVDYLRPLLRGDPVEARTWVSTVMAAKVNRNTELVRASDAVVVAKAVTTWGFVDVATGRPTRIPNEVRRAFGYADRQPTHAR